MRKWKRRGIIAASVIAIIICVFKPALMATASGDKGALWWYLLFAPLALLNYDSMCNYIEVSRKVTKLSDEFENELRRLREGVFIFSENELIGIANKCAVPDVAVGCKCTVVIRELHLKRRMYKLPDVFLIIKKSPDSYVVLHKCSVGRLYRDADGDIIGFEAVGEIDKKGRARNG